MRIFLILFFTFFFGKSKAQITAAYKSYASNINLAELAAIDHNYTTALDFYKNAFSYKNVFAKDYYNAAVCAQYLNKHDDALQDLKKIIAKGYSIDSLEQDNFFKPFFTKKDIEDLKKVPIQKHNAILKNTLDSMLYADQFFRRKDSRNYMNSIYADTIKMIDSMNAKALEKIITEKGFPSEFDINLDADRITNYHWDALIIHQGFGSPSRYVDFSPMILKALQEGMILSHNGNYLYARCSGTDTLFCLGSIFKIMDSQSYKYAYFELDKTKEEKYNLHRLNYGMENLEDYRKKIVYWLHHKDLIFDFSIGNDINLIEKEVIDQFPDNFKTLKDLE